MLSSANLCCPCCSVSAKDAPTQIAVRDCRAHAFVAFRSAKGRPAMASLTARRVGVRQPDFCCRLLPPIHPAPKNRNIKKGKRVLSGVLELPIGDAQRPRASSLPRRS